MENKVLFSEETESKSISIDTGKININPITSSSSLLKVSSDDITTINIESNADDSTNHAPVAGLAYSILNPATLTSDNYLTTNTQVAWLLSYNGVNYSYDPDGDSIIAFQVGGLPSGSITSTVTDSSGTVIGFVVQVTTAGTYKMTFRCEDEHGLWSSYLVVTMTIKAAS